MSEDIKTAAGGSVPGRLIITLAPKGMEAARERIAPTRTARLPAVMKETGVETLDAARGAGVRHGKLDGGHGQ